MSMYGDYLKEQRGDEIIERPFGFVSYRFLNDQQVYIVDIYVVPECRKKGAATALADEVCKKAKESGHTEILGSVVPQAKDSAASLMVLLGYNMKLLSAGPDLILFKKEIN